MKRRGMALASAAAVALLLGALFLYAKRVDARRDGSARGFAVEATRDSRDPGHERGDLELAEVAHAAPDARRESAAPTDATVRSTPPTPTVHRRVRVLDIAGDPVAGVVVAPIQNPVFPIGSSAADGTCDLPPGSEGADLEVVDDRWYTLRDTEPLERPDGVEVFLLVAPRIRVGGRVEGPDGLPIRDAQIGLELPAAVFATFPVPLDRARPAREFARVTSGVDGSFELAIPGVEHGRLVVAAGGRVGTTIEAPRESRFDLVVRLAAEAPSTDPHVAGVVLHADGSPGIGSTVRYGNSTTQVDSEGRFDLSISLAFAEGRPLVAVKRGFQPAVVADFWATVQYASGKTLPFQQLVLGGPPLAIEGRVVDSGGEPRPGWQVQPVDPLVLMEGRIPPECAEALVLGTQVSAQTDADGRFRLEGLIDRTYRLQAHSGKDLVRIESDPIPAGARNVQLVVPADAHIAEVQGVVVAADGSPIAGVDVRFALVVFRTKTGYTMEHSPAVSTDAEGRFRLTRVPRRSSRIDVTGDAILPAGLDLADHVEGERVRIVVARRCHARVEGVSADTKFTWFRVQDARGENLQLMQFQSGGWWSSDQVQLAGGASPVFAVSEAARTIVFQGEGVAEVARPIVLVPGEITVARW